MNQGSLMHLKRKICSALTDNGLLNVGEPVFFCIKETIYHKWIEKTRMLIIFKTILVCINWHGSNPVEVHRIWSTTWITN